MSISLQGFQEAYATFYAPADAGTEDSTFVPGTLVTLGEGYVVDTPADGGLFAGVLTHMDEDGCALVQLKGYVRVPYSGTAPAYGYTALCSDASGKVRAPAQSAAGRYVLVCDVDAATRTAGIILL